MRSEQDWIRSLVVEGDRDSSTFHHLLAALNNTDVIVYIVIGPPDLGTHEGRLLHHIAPNESTRYLRIVLSPRRSHEHLIGLIAHELQHAREVAENPYVRTGNHIRQLFERIGFPVGGGAFETRAAQEIESEVVAELRTTRTTASSERQPRVTPPDTQAANVASTVIARPVPTISFTRSSRGAGREIPRAQWQMRGARP